MKLYEKVKPYVSVKEMFNRARNDADEGMATLLQILSNYGVRVGLGILICTGVGALAGDSSTGADVGFHVGGIEYICEVLTVNRDVVKDAFSHAMHKIYQAMYKNSNGA